MKMSVEQAWLEFAIGVLPEDMTRADFDEFKVTFFAGATFTLLAIRAMALNNDPKMFLHYRQMLDECQTYIDGMAARAG